MTSNAKSFMIDDILRSEETKKEDGNQEELTPSRTLTHYNFIMNDFYSQFCNVPQAEPHPSSAPMMQDPRVQTLFWQHLFLRRKIMLQLKPRKGGQIRFSHQQIIDLERRFHKSKYLSASERRKIASRINLSERQVKTWFQNRRAKWRRGTGIPDAQETDSHPREDTDSDASSPPPH